MSGGDPFAPLAAVIAAPILAELRDVRAQLEQLRAELRAASETLLDDKGAAAHLGLSVAAFRARARRQPELRSVAVGGARFRRWRRADLDGVMAARGRR